MSFDTLAAHYGWMELVLAGEKLQRCRVEFLDEIPDARNILLMGEGHGRCLLGCCCRFPDARVVCVDASERMLEEARRRLTCQGMPAGGVDFIHADVLTWSPPSGVFDLIGTHFFLDCFREDQLGNVIGRIATAATPKANWLLADFQKAAAGLKRVRSQLILWAMYTFFRAATRLPASQLTAPDVFLRQSGFVLQRRVESEWGLLHSDWWCRAGQLKTGALAEVPRPIRRTG